MAKCLTNPKKLYENGSYTEKAFAIEDSLIAQLQPIFDKYAAEGYSPRGLKVIAAGAAHRCESYTRNQHMPGKPT